MTADVVVLGGGVTGLTAALLLAESGRRVEIVTAEPSAITTSAVAGAMIGPVIDADPRVLGWLRDGDARFRALARDPSTGVRIASGRLLPHHSDDPDADRSGLPGYRPCTGSEVPPGMAGLFWIELPIVDMPRYLAHLGARLVAAGVRTTVRAVRSLEEAATLAPEILHCTGVFAQQLAGDPTTRPVRGQHVVVDNPGLDDFFYQGGPIGSSWVSWFPQGDRVVLGGNALPDVWDRTPDPRVTEEIIERAVRVEPLFAGARVREVLVGLRPARPTIRIEAEYIRDTAVVHCYGHGGNGVMLSWGSATDAVALLDSTTVGAHRIHPTAAALTP